MFHNVLPRNQWNYICYFFNHCWPSSRNRLYGIVGRVITWGIYVKYTTRSRRLMKMNLQLWYESLFSVKFIEKSTFLLWPLKVNTGMSNLSVHCSLLLRMAYRGAIRPWASYPTILNAIFQNIALRFPELYYIYWSRIRLLFVTILSAFLCHWYSLIFKYPSP